MVPPTQAKPGRPQQQQSNKRKQPPDGSAPKTGNRHNANKRPRFDHASKARDARTLAVQTSSKAFKNGEVDVDKFVKSREFEIRALEQGLANSKKALTKRAFQMVPKTLRRRTASHNVKRVPKRLRERGKREMKEDNTPTVNARTRKPTRHKRLRLETAKKLRELGAKRKSSKAKANDSEGTDNAGASLSDADKHESSDQLVKTRAAKVKKLVLAKPPPLKAKFKKRQKDKSWLPTHLFHAKRARMTPPSQPLWRFAVPLTPTAKTYRPTHRAASERGAIAWDTSYMSTILLSGRVSSIQTVLQGLGAQVEAPRFRVTESHSWTGNMTVSNKVLHQREAPHTPIAPVSILWCPKHTERSGELLDKGEKQIYDLLIRVHPSAFLQLWEEVLRLCKVAKPAVAVEDLRFEIGSIEVTGPGSTETLLSALWPSSPKFEEGENQGHRDGGSLFAQFNGLVEPALLPAGSALDFCIQDPRLHHPPRPLKPATAPDSHLNLLETVAAWPIDNVVHGSDSIFNRKTRTAALSTLTSQKAINRRKTHAPPGQYPAALPTDPRIPTLLYTSPDRHHGRRHSKWIVLLPWKCVAPVWYSMMYTPLSTGGQPLFGGLDGIRQLCLEHGQAWFPADYPGTNAGWEWELQERRKRKEDWQRKPKSKRVDWGSLDLGIDPKGEVGIGWACDWERLIRAPPETGLQSSTDGLNAESQAAPPKPDNLMHINAHETRSLLKGIGVHNGKGLIAVRIEFITRGVPKECARIYRLPSSADLRKRWLSLHPKSQGHPKRSKQALPKIPPDAPPHVARQLLARSLLERPRAGENDYPTCPGEEDLIGFVTSGNYDLGAGRGMGIGNVLLSKVIDGAKKDVAKGAIDEGRLCIVRNAGLSVGRLARWDVVG